MKVCPECDTPQTSDEPFCENCGYRLRSAETQLEGLPAISPEMLMASKLRRPERVATEDVLEQVSLVRLGYRVQCVLDRVSGRRAREFDDMRVVQQFVGQAADFAGHGCGEQQVLTVAR